MKQFRLAAAAAMVACASSSATARRGRSARSAELCAVTNLLDPSANTPRSQLVQC